MYICKGLKYPFVNFDVVRIINKTYTEYQKILLADPLTAADQ